MESRKQKLQESGKDLSGIAAIAESMYNDIAVGEFGNTKLAFNQIKDGLKELNDEHINTKISHNRGRD